MVVRLTTIHSALSLLCWKKMLSIALPNNSRWTVNSGPTIWLADLSPPALMVTHPRLNLAGSSEHDGVGSLRSDLLANASSAKASTLWNYRPATGWRSQWPADVQVQRKYHEVQLWFQFRRT